MKGQSPIVSGKMFRITITGEIPPNLIGGNPQETSATVLSCVSVSTALIGVITKVDCSLGELRPADSPPT